MLIPSSSLEEKQAGDALLREAKELGYQTAILPPSSAQRAGAEAATATGHSRHLQARRHLCCRV